MKPISILTLLVLSALVITSCRGQATPTANPIDLQGTIAAAAFTVVAQTQAAIPTATVPPPTATFTDTPAPTSTFPPLPASGATFTPIPNSNSGGGDPCINKVMPATLQGQPVKIRVNNTTKVKLTFSIYLNQATPQSQCGYRIYTLEPEQALVIGDLVPACYTLWAWNPDPKEYFIVTNGTTCIDSTDTWVFSVSNSSIKVK